MTIFSSLVSSGSTRAISETVVSNLERPMKITIHYDILTPSLIINIITNYHDSMFELLIYLSHICSKKKTCIDIYKQTEVVVKEVKGTDWSFLNNRKFLLNFWQKNTSIQDTRSLNLSQQCCQSFNTFCTK